MTVIRLPQLEQERVVVTSPEIYLLKGPMPELRKMKVAELKEECQMWRNVWGWVPSEVKYYVARVGQQIGVVQINFQRKLGVLLDTKWDLIALEIGIYDKEYDPVDGKYYFERKIVQIKAGGIRAIDWIKERKSEEEILGTEAQPSSKDLKDTSTQDIPSDSERVE